MREIKFRVWDKDNSQMYYQIEDFKDLALINGQFKPVLNNLINNSFNWYRRNYELMQYTGLKDKNGTEIYEGDIVFGEESKIICEVIYTEGAMFMLRWNDTKWGNNEYHHYGLGAFTLEVIGNIYENPELLKEGE